MTARDPASPLAGRIAGVTFATQAARRSVRGTIPDTDEAARETILATDTRASVALMQVAVARVGVSDVPLPLAA